MTHSNAFQAVAMSVMSRDIAAMIATCCAASRSEANQQNRIEISARQ